MGEGICVSDPNYMDCGLWAQKLGKIILNYNNYHFMRASVTIIFALFVLSCLSIPFHDQIALVNSLEVGRDEEPMVWSCVGCDASNKPISSTIIEEKIVETRAILSVYSEYSVLAFRYTANIKNIEQDILWAIQHQDEHACKGCKVQAEMDNMWGSIRDETITGLRNLPHTDRLIITGISLGGALTVLSYVDIAQAKIFKSIELVTFGAPRVGNKKWAAWFDTQTPSTRYTLSEDPIPVLPVCLTLLCNYGQTGDKVQCRKNTKTCHCMDGSDDIKNLRVQKMLPAAIEHLTEREHESTGLGIGILDHIQEYKNVKDYTLVC